MIDNLDNQDNYSMDVRILEKKLRNGMTWTGVIKETPARRTASTAKRN